MRFLLHRSLQALLLLILASVLSFSLIELAPGDYFQVLKLNPQITPETFNAIRQQHGLDRPATVRYLLWLRSVLKGDWGYSFAYNLPAGPILYSRARNTLILTSIATALAWIVALPLGIWAAARPGSWVDFLTSATIAAFLATPELVLALLLLSFAVKTGYFPAGGMETIIPPPSTLETGSQVWTQILNALRHIALPSFCLAAGIFPLIASHVRAAVRETLQSQQVRTARAYGIPYTRVILRHALPMAANPLISLIGLSLGTLLSSSLLVEAVFSWPGLGQLMLEAILQRDMFLVLDSTIFGIVFLIAGSLIADMLLYAADPRIRAD